MKEIPIPYVRANQSAMVALITASILLHQPWLIVLVWAVELAGLAFGVRGNLFVALARPFLKTLAQRSAGEAVELQRFNNSIAVALLTLAVVSFAFGWVVTGFVFAGMVAVAAFGAILGYCVGCTVYYQIKQWRLRHGAHQR